MIVAGYAYTRDANRRRVAVARVHLDGRVDRHFGRDGRATTRLDPRTSDTATGVAVGSHGKVTLSVESCRPFVRCRFAVARFRRDGRLDPSFSRDGRRLITFGTRDADANDVTIDRRDRTVAVGSVHRRRTGSDLVVVRLR